MLISFSLANWMSFHEEACFSMVASRERQHGDRISRLDKYKTTILPIAALYGGNASGKSNFFEALNFCKKFIVRGLPPDSLIPVEPFQLSATCIHEPSKFRFLLLVDEILYEFSFSVTSKAVLEEKLMAIFSTKEKVLYHRLDGKPHFDASLEKDSFLQFAFNGTRDNQLFLTNAVSQKIDRFKPVYDWFKNTLELVAPDSHFLLFGQFLDEGHPIYTTINELLQEIDTGIAHLGLENISFKNLLLPAYLKTMLQQELTEGRSAYLFAPDHKRYVVSRKDNELRVKKLVTYHTQDDGNEVLFEIRQESNGTQRVLDLLPAFLELAMPDSKKVYVIDDLDLSLHTLLTRKLLEAYLAGCGAKSRTQLLLSLQDVLLMDQHLLRRDEMWLTERDANGNSVLLSVSDYKDVRYDKDIRKSYLQGRLGGIPKIPLDIALRQKIAT